VGEERLYFNLGRGPRVSFAGPFPPPFFSDRRQNTTRAGRASRRRGAQSSGPLLFRLQIFRVYKHPARAPRHGGYIV